MPEKSIDIIMLQRIDEEQKATASRVAGLDQTLRRLDREVGEINGKLKPQSEPPPWMRYVVFPLCVVFVIAITTAVVRLSIQMSAVERFEKESGSFVAELRLEKTDPAAPKEAELILGQARKDKIQISTDVLTKTGDRFISASDSAPAAWSAALAFLSYRSFLNDGFISVSVKHAVEDKHLGTSYFQWVPTGRSGTTALLKAYGTAPVGEGAVMSAIGFASPRPAAHDNQFIVLYDGEVVLDGTEFKHVIISNAHIIWRGSPVILQDVYFLNCTFDLPQATGQSLASAILGNTSVSFQAS